MYTIFDFQLLHNYQGPMVTQAVKSSSLTPRIHCILFNQGKYHWFLGGLSSFDAPGTGIMFNIQINTAIITCRINEIFSSHLIIIGKLLVMFP